MMVGVDARSNHGVTDRSTTRMQHPAVGAALAARNAVAAEMAMAARSGHHPSHSCWDAASDVVTGADAGARQLAVAMHSTQNSPSMSGALPPRSRQRRRRELLEMCFWFVVGGLGGLAALAAVRVVESFFLSP